MKHSLVLSIAFSILSQPFAFGRWADRPDLFFEVVSSRHSFNVKKDGTYQVTEEMQVKVLKQDARASVSPYRISYPSSSCDVKVLDARTTVEGQDYVVSSNEIEDKPQASSAAGFDLIRQISIGFPQVQVGALLSFKISRRCKVPIIAKQFSQSFMLLPSFNEVWPVEIQHSVIEIRSELPLFFKMHDPEGYLDARKQKEGGIVFRLKRPFMKALVDENAAIQNPKTFPQVSVSSLPENRWDLFVEEIGKRVDRVLNEPLPPLFQAILNEAKALSQKSEQLTFVMEKLSDQVSYLGNWGSVDGKIYPRSLSLVAEKRQADCKDYAAATIAILRKLGMDAKMAFVARGLNPYPFIHPKLPFLRFDHAIVRLKDGETVTWIDPTNSVSFAGTFSDIADRDALVLDGTHSHLEQIPALKAEDHTVKLVVHSEIENEKKLAHQTSLSISGLSALYFTQAGLDLRQTSLERYILESLIPLSEVLSFRFEPFQLGSRVLRPLHFEFEFVQNRPFHQTSAGYVFFPSESTLNLWSGYLTNRSERQGDLVVANHPIKIERELHFHSRGKLKPVLGKTKECQVKTPWVEVRRTLRKQGDEIVQKDTLLVKKTVISNDELQTAAFGKFQEDLRECFSPLGMLLEKSNG